MSWIAAKSKVELLSHDWVRRPQVVFQAMLFRRLQSLEASPIPDVADLVLYFVISHRRQCSTKPFEEQGSD